MKSPHALHKTIALTIFHRRRKPAWNGPFLRFHRTRRAHFVSAKHARIRTAPKSIQTLCRRGNLPVENFSQAATFRSFPIARTPGIGRIACKVIRLPLLPIRRIRKFSVIDGAPRRIFCRAWNKVSLEASCATIRSRSADWPCRRRLSSPVRRTSRLLSDWISHPQPCRGSSRSRRRSPFRSRPHQ